MDKFEQSRLQLFGSQGLEVEATRLTDASGRTTAAVVSGTGDRTTLLIHGVLSNAGEWALVAPKLSGRLVIPDWPGSGLSPAAPVREVGIRRFAVEWLSSILDALDADEVDIVGSSAGAYMGLAFALAEPRRVRRLVQLGSFPGLRRTAPLIFRLFAAPVVGRLLLNQRPKDGEANRREVFSNLTAHPERIPVAMLEADLEAMALPNAVPSGVDFCRAMVNPLTGIRPEVMLDQDLAGHTVPTLSLWGSEDNFVPVKAVQSVLGSAPCITLEIVEDAGHLLTLEAPDHVAGRIEAFLAD